MSRHHLYVVEQAARHHIAIDAHEPIKGHRPAPHLSELGCRGEKRAAWEYNAWGDPPNPPEHEANLVFTRLLSGPMDFTPAC